MVVGVHDAQHPQAVSPLRLMAGDRQDATGSGSLDGWTRSSPRPARIGAVGAQQKVTWLSR